MRKTRLVILPTKCLHQMGFLLLFLSCPVIGDWGRIRPESENSHNAIQIEREGTCGLERDPPGGLLDFLNDTGSKQCRLSEDTDMNKPTEKPGFEQPMSFRRSDDRRVHVRRINQRETERRIAERSVRRDVRSRSVESRRLNTRNDIRVRSLSLSRIEDERTARDRRFNEGNRRDSQRLRMTRQNERRVEQRRVNRELPNERRENEIRERRERETRRFTRSVERERQDNNRRSLSTRREDETRTQTRDRTDRRLSLSRREVREERKEERRIDLERRLPEIRKSRSLEFISREKPVRMNRDSDNRRDAENRRVSLSPKISERDTRERRVSRLNDSKSRRINVATIRELNLEIKKAEEEKPFEENSNWMNFKTYDNFKTGDWTTNCVIGAVVYFLTTRQIKTV